MDTTSTADDSQHTTNSPNESSDTSLSLQEQHKTGVCDPLDVSLKSFFLGPKAENAELTHEIIDHIFEGWYNWRRELYPEDGRAISEKDQQNEAFVERRQNFENYVDQLTQRFRDEIPTFTPRYIGHMQTDISLPALMGHIVTLLHNPNNITGEASRVGIEIEDEAIHDLAAMHGYNPDRAVGHFTSGGTVANFEGAVRARARMARWLALGAIARTQGKELSLFEAAHMGWDQYDEFYEWLDTNDDTLSPYHILKENPLKVAQRYREIFDHPYHGPVVLVPENKHYSWQKAVKLLGLGEEAFWPVALDERGRQDVSHLKQMIEKAHAQHRPVMMVVSVAGTTELGDFDPVDQVTELLEEYAQQGIHIWHHVDGAYGGFFCSLRNKESEYVSDQMQAALNAIGKSNSLTVDPHKLGYVPYASGTFMCNDHREYYSNSVKAPYIDFDAVRDKGPQTLEGSRSAAGAVSTWLTSKSIGLDENGYGRILERSIQSRIMLEDRLRNTSDFIRIAPDSETNIACFCVAKPHEPTEMTNKRTRQIFEHYSTVRNRPFFVSKTELQYSAFQKYLDRYLQQWDGMRNTESLTLIRLTLMNPFFSTKETKIIYAEQFVTDLKGTIADLV
jgi:glutamate/tyrosine decarboxylase-like PLP-dependent enzyme